MKLSTTPQTLLTMSPQALLVKTCLLKRAEHGYDFRLQSLNNFRGDFLKLFCGKKYHKMFGLIIVKYKY